MLFFVCKFASLYVGFVSLCKPIPIPMITCNKVEELLMQEVARVDKRIAELSEFEDLESKKALERNLKEREILKDLQKRMDPHHCMEVYEVLRKIIDK